MNLRRFVSIALVVLASLGVASSGAYGLAMLRVSDGVTTVTVTDNLAGDLNPLAGVIVVSQAVGVWFVNVDVGISKPVLGGVAAPHMDLSASTASGLTTSANTLTISFTDTGFSPFSSANFDASIGGTSMGSVTYATFLDPGNTAFGTTIPLTSQGPFTPVFPATSFSGNQNAGPVAPTGTYSLTQVTTIFHPGGSFPNIRNTSFDAELNGTTTPPIPEPATLLLLGSGVVGFGYLRRRRRA